MYKIITECDSAGISRQWRKAAVLCEAVLAMEAVDPALNRFRVWRIEAGRDLLGDLVIVVKFGRKGAPGRTIINATVDEAAARRLWRRSVARRAGAKRRIGVAYRVVESAGLEPWMAAGAGPA